MSDLARLLQQYGYGLPPASPQGETVSTSNALSDALRVAGVPKKDEHGFLFSNVGGELKFNPWEAVKGFMSYKAPPGALSTSGDDAPVRNSAEAAGWLGLSGLGLNMAGQVPANALGAVGARLSKPLSTRAYHGTNTEIPNGFEIDKMRASVLNPPRPNFAVEAPEASGYAMARAEERGGRPSVMPVDVSFKNPLPVWFSDPAGKITPKQYERLTGEPFTRTLYDGTPAQASVDEAIRAMLSQESDGFKGNVTEAWERVISRLQDLGHDGFVYRNVPADFSDNYYTKLVPLKKGTVKSATTGKTLFSAPVGLPIGERD